MSDACSLHPDPSTGVHDAEWARGGGAPSRPTGNNLTLSKRPDELQLTFLISLIAASALGVGILRYVFHSGNRLELGTLSHVPEGCEDSSRRDEGGTARALCARRA